MQEFSILNDISLSIIFATFSAYILKTIKQPTILAYVLGGIILGPGLGLSLINNEHNIEIISEIGLIFLVFIIGLEINIKHILNMGKNIIILSISQFFLGFILTFLFFKFIPFFNLTTNFDFIYIAIALNLSSTLIVVKILKDKFETETLAGQITIGILVIQDIWAIIFMAFQPNFLNPKILSLLYSFILGVIMIFFSFYFSKNILSKLLKSVSKTPELILLSAIAWCFLIASIADKIGLSKEMGALIAGMSIAAFPYGNDIITKISGIRDFFVTLFFVSLGLKFPILNKEIFYFSIIAVIIVLLTRFISMLGFYKILKIGLRPIFITSINLSQISEFSLVIFALGVSYGHISKNLQMQILVSMLLASLFATYLINYNDKIYSIIGNIFKIKENEKIISNELKNNEDRDILILGYFKETIELISLIEKLSPQILKKISILDFNLANKEYLNKKDINWFYADLSNTETLKHINISKPKIILSSISDIFLKGTNNKKILKELKEIFPDSKFIMIGSNEKEKEYLLSKGSFKVINPHEEVAQKMFNVLLENV